MADPTRPPAGSSTVERGEVPEVAALGNTLTRLFNTLGISQRGYAARVQLHHSIVSRYLGGQRVASRDFVERLIQEAQEQLGAPLKEAAKTRVREQRLAAVRATDPAEYEVELARQEVAHARRAIARLEREQAALHEHMDRLEAELAAVTAERKQLGHDWARDRAASRHRELELLAATAEHRHIRETLEGELTRARADLADVNALKTDAQARCRTLEDRVLGLEEELAALRAAREQEAAPERPLSVLELLDRLSSHLVAGRPREVTRALEAAAWERPADELFRILGWLVVEARHRADWLVGLVCEYRSVDTVAALGEQLPALGREVELDRELLSEAVRARTPQDLAHLYARWVTAEDCAMGDALLARAVWSARAVDLVALLGLVDDAPATERAVRETARHGFQPRRLFGIARRLAEQGRDCLAAAVLAALVHIAERAVGGAGAFREEFVVLLPHQRADLAGRILTAAAPLSMLRLLYSLYDVRQGEVVADELIERAAAEGALPALLANAPTAYPSGELSSAAELRELLRTYQEPLVGDV
ncbi:hypothetical protein [Streptomyces sp. NPDC006879]|uniref:hypothetical protein n=1 Tax=Streptomyces sp. NPDC006879 TaxID=3364767 RepID=UPI00369361C5